MASRMRLPPLPTISEIVRMHGLKAQKRLSQNYLLDMNINKKIVRAAGNITDGYVCEVGPGPGGITRAILEQNVKELVVVESDGRFIPSLQMLGDAGGGVMKIYHGDVLQFDMENVFPEHISKKWDDEPPNVHVIGNLPFSVATPLLIKLLHAISERRGFWKHGRSKLTLTFQKEVAEDMVVRPGSRDRSRLSVMCQYLCDVRMQFVIPGSSFVPPPKVNVGLVTFEPLKKPLISQPFKLVEKVVRHLFAGKNKFLRKNVALLFPPDMPELTAQMIESTEVNPEIVITKVTNEEIGRLCHVYNYICQQHPYIAQYDYRSPDSRKLVEKSRQIELEKIEKQILLGSDVPKESIISNKDNT